MKFTKMHGCGNDYVFVDCFTERVPDPVQTSIKVSDRHFGIGSDGLITIEPTMAADFKMRIWNADGSEAEMCGNGIRCVAKYVYDHGLTDKTEIDIETLGGIKHLELAVEGGKVEKVRVDMGEPRLDRELIPMSGEPGRVIGESLLVADRTFPITCVSMGNPHTVIRVEGVATFPIEKYGPLIERHDKFPKRTNVEFIEIISKSEIRQRTWERGSNETYACGTGASAVCVASNLNGWTGRNVLIHLLGGDLEIEWAADNHVYKTGPATEVFTGEINL